MSNGVHWVRNSAEHDAAFRQTYACATRALERLAAGREPGTWAVVADSDETVLDNSQYQKEREQAGLRFTQESWGDWVRRREATPLPGSVAFFRRVRELGGRIAIVTNRRESLCPDTAASFDAHQIAYDVILCRPEEGPSEKESRFERIRSGLAAPDLPPLEIVMWLGDNIQDFPGRRQELRRAPEPRLEDFGTRFFVFPNPVYGSWLRNPRE
jgi:5'-nucleotidase (lipoprotein e(P4) family)